MGKRNNHVTLCMIGFFYAVGYSVLDIDFGQGPISSAQAWNQGVAQPYVLAGVVLILLSTLYYRGQTWVRWPIMLWYPLTVTGGAVWASWAGAATFDVFQLAVLGGGISVIAIFCGWYMFFREPEQ